MATETSNTPDEDAPRRTKARAKLVPLWESEARSGPKLEARAHLLEAAATAFMERGFAATTLDHVAAGLGTTKGQIYHYYRSKSDLYFDVVVGANFVVNEKTGPIFDRLDLPAVERLYQVAYAHASVIMATWVWQRVSLEATQHQLITSLTPRERRAMTRATDLRDDYERRFAAIIAEGMESGALRRASTAFATKAALGSLNWLTVWYDPRRATDHPARDQLANRMAEFVLAGLMPADLSLRDAAKAAIAEMTGAQSPR